VLATKAGCERLGAPHHRKGLQMRTLLMEVQDDERDRRGIGRVGPADQERRSRSKLWKKRAEKPIALLTGKREYGKRQTIAAGGSRREAVRALRACAGGQGSNGAIVRVRYRGYLAGRWAIHSSRSRVSSDWPPGSTNPCETKKFTKGGEATFGQTSVPPATSVSIGVTITPGLVADNKPHMEPIGSKLSSAGRMAAILAAVSGLVAVGSLIVGMLWWRKNGRDQRYADLAPGTVPLPGQEVRVVPNDPNIPIPVAFSPPPIPVAEAGLLIDGQVDSRETAATIIDLAVRGALTVQSHGEDDFRVTLIDANKAAAPHETVLLTTLFAGEPPGAERDLSVPGSIASAHEQVRDSVRNQVTARGWFRNVPSAAGTSTFGSR
jgi:Predicted membrane protein (DUF2207)